MPTETFLLAKQNLNIYLTLPGIKICKLRKLKKITHICLSAKNCRVDMNVGRLLAGGLWLDDWPCWVVLLNSLVQIKKSLWGKDIVPGQPKLVQSSAAFLIGTLEDVAECRDYIGWEKTLVGIRVILHNGVHQVEHGQFQLSRCLNHFKTFCFHWLWNSASVIWRNFTTWRKCKSTWQFYRKYLRFATNLQQNCSKFYWCKW